MDAWRPKPTINEILLTVVQFVGIISAEFIILTMFITL